MIWTIILNTPNRLLPPPPSHCFLMPKCLIFIAASSPKYTIWPQSIANRAQLDAKMRNIDWLINDYCYYCFVDSRYFRCFVAAHIDRFLRPDYISCRRLKFKSTEHILILMQCRFGFGIVYIQWNRLITVIIWLRMPIGKTHKMSTPMAPFHLNSVHLCTNKLEWYKCFFVCAVNAFIYTMEILTAIFDVW